MFTRKRPDWVVAIMYPKAWAFFGSENGLPMIPSVNFPIFIFSDTMTSHDWGSLQHFQIDPETCTTKSSIKNSRIFHEINHPAIGIYDTTHFETQKV